MSLKSWFQWFVTLLMICEGAATVLCWYLTSRSSVEGSTVRLKWINLLRFLQQPVHGSESKSDICDEKQRPCCYSAAGNLEKNHGNEIYASAFLCLCCEKSKQSGNRSDAIRAILRTWPTVQAVAVEGVRSPSHMLISSTVMDAACLKILTLHMLFLSSGRIVRVTINWAVVCQSSKREII